MLTILYFSLVQLRVIQRFPEIKVMYSISQRWITARYITFEKRWPRYLAKTTFEIANNYC